jgi:hypothetical protein
MKRTLAMPNPLMSSDSLAAVITEELFARPM